MSELRRLSVTCDFANNLDSSLRDRLVCGINDDGIQQRLLAEKTLDFNKAFALAQSMEMAARNVQDMKHQSHVNTLINEDTYRDLWENPPVLQPAHECLRSYLGEKIPLLGSTRVNIKYGDQSAYVQVGETGAG